MSAEIDMRERDEHASNEEQDPSLGEATSTISELRQRISELEKEASEQLKLEGAQKILKEEKANLSKRLTESNTALGKAVERAEQMEKDAALEDTETDRLREELKSFREEASRCSREDDREIRKLKREKSDAEKKIRRLSSEVDELRKVIEEHVERINTNQSSTARDNSAALRTELRLVREQAERDLTKMRNQLRERELSGSAENAENDVLRREIADFQQEREKQEKRLEKALSEQQQLKEGIELQKSEVDRLQRALDIVGAELEESKFQRKEELEARLQLEEKLHEMQQKAGDSYPLVSDRQLKNFSNQSNSAHRGQGQHPATGGMKGMVIGALLAFILADGISLLRGRGEIITGLMETERIPEKIRQFPSESVGQLPGIKPKAVSEPTGEPTPSGQAAVTENTAGMTRPLPRSQTPVAGKIETTPTKEPATGTIIQDRLRRGGRGPMMIYIRGSEFAMGRQRDQLDRDEGPAHQVSLNRFSIARDEITFDDYMVFARATGRKAPDDQGWGRGRRPVINVNWKDARAYAKWLSGQTGRRYRLPTEAEWEYAAAAGSDAFYWWGYQIGEEHASCFDCGSRWDGSSTAPVGSFDSNPFGINDTAGNVVEWVEDCYHDSYQGAPVDGSAWVETGCPKRVARGGAYNKPSDSLRTTKRFYYDPGTRLPILGFRVVRELE